MNNPGARRKPRGLALGAALPNVNVLLGVTALIVFGLFLIRVYRQVDAVGAGSRAAADLGVNQTAAGVETQKLLQEIMKQVSETQEQQREWQQREQAERARQLDRLQGALDDVRDSVARQEAQSADVAGQKASLDDLKQRVEETLRSSVAEQRGLLEEQNSMLTLIHSATLQREAQLEYGRKAPNRERNFTLLTVTDDHPDQWEQRTFRRYGAYGFIRYSAYRVSRSRVTVLGLAARAAHVGRRLESCQWHCLNGTAIEGRLTATYDAEHHNFVYQTALLHCDLSEPLRQSGGHLSARIDGELMFLYRETSAQPLDLPRGDGPFMYDVAFCGPPMFSELLPRAVSEFVEYHFASVGVDHFLLYDSGAVGEVALRGLAPYLQQGVVTITDFREAAMWDVWSWAQSLALHDCSYRLQPLAKWALMQDLDEYLEVQPPQSLKGLLQKHEGRPWLTTGCIVFSIHHCEGGNGSSPLTDDPEGKHGALIARMTFRWPHVYCQKDKVTDRNFCQGQLGHRKYIVNPRKVKVLQIHEVVIPTNGVHLSVSDVRQVHFQGLAKSGQELCQKGQPDTWWVHYDRIMRISEAVRGCQRDPRTNLCLPGKIDVGPSGLLGAEKWKLLKSSHAS